MKDNKGITLITLVITIIVLAILASISTYTGINVIQSAKLTAFTTELKIMQTQVNAIYQKNSETNIGLELTADESIKKQADIVFTENESEIKSYEGYRYWSQDLIKELGIEGVEKDFFVNLKERSVVSYQGFEYKGKTYYTLNQLPNGLYNVEYENPNTGKPAFDVNVECIGKNKYKMTIQNVKYDGYIDKWNIQYQLQGKDNWITTEEMSFVVNTEGTYKIKLVNGTVASEELEKRTTDCYVQEDLILQLDGINNTKTGHDNTATIWEDLSGNGNDANLSNFNNTDESGWKSEGLKFDGQNDIVKTNGKFNFSSLKAGTSFSYGATITVKDVLESWYGIMTNMTTWRKGGFNIQYGSAEKIAIGMGTYVNSITQPAANTTYNIYGVYDGSTMKLYVNGKLEGSSTYDITAGNKIMTIGYFYDTPSLPMNGEILNIKIYQKELTEQEIKKNVKIDKERFNMQNIEI